VRVCLSVVLPYVLETDEAELFSGFHI
jgi:hypothetical protein